MPVSAARLMARGNLAINVLEARQRRPAPHSGENDGGVRYGSCERTDGGMSEVVGVRIFFAAH